MTTSWISFWKLNLKESYGTLLETEFKRVPWHALVQKADYFFGVTLMIMGLVLLPACIET